MAVAILDSQRLQAINGADRYVDTLKKVASGIAFPTLEEVSSKLKLGELVILASAARIDTNNLEISLVLNDGSVSPVDDNIWRVVFKEIGTIAVRNVKTWEVRFLDRSDRILPASTMVDSDGKITKEFKAEIIGRVDSAHNRLKEAFLYVVSGIQYFKRGIKYQENAIHEYDPIKDPLHAFETIILKHLDGLKYSMAPQYPGSFWSSLTDVKKLALDSIQAIKPDEVELRNAMQNFESLGLESDMTHDIRKGDIIVMGGSNENKAFQIAAIGEVETGLRYSVKIVELKGDESGLPTIKLTSNGNEIDLSSRELYTLIHGEPSNNYGDLYIKTEISKLPKIPNYNLTEAIRLYNVKALAEWHRGLCFHFLRALEVRFSGN